MTHSGPAIMILLCSRAGCYNGNRERHNATGKHNPRERIMIGSKKGMTLFFTFALILSVTFACEKSEPVFECKDSSGCVNLAPGEPVRIGVLQTLSGKVAALGYEQLRGIELAVSDRKGMILGHSIHLQMEDIACTPEGGANGALKLIADPRTVAVLGTTCSGSAVTASKVMSDAGLVMISGNNSAPFLTSIGGKQAPHWHAGYFRTSYNEENSGKTAAVYAFKQLGVHRAALINDGDIYTTGLTEGFRESFEKLGGKIVLSSSVNKGEQEMNPLLTAVMNSGADMIFFPLFQPEANNILLQARKIHGLDNVVLMSGGALIESSFLSAVKEEGKGMYFVGPSSSSNPAAVELSKKYLSRYGCMPATSYYLFAYDTVGLLTRGIEHIAVIGKDGSIHIGRDALRKSLYSVKDFIGMSGKLTCNEFGDCARPVFNVLRLDDPNAGLSGLQSNVLFTYEPER